MGARVDIFLAAGPHEIVLSYREGDVTIASDTVVVTVHGASLIEDPADGLPGSIDILSVDTSIDGDSFLCEFVVRSGAEGLTDKSRYTCYLDFDDLEIDGRQITAWLNELAGKLGELKNAIESRDNVLLGDILRYEFDQTLQQWERMLGGFIAYVEQLGGPESAGGQ